MSTLVLLVLFAHDPSIDEAPVATPPVATPPVTAPVLEAPASQSPTTEKAEIAVPASMPFPPRLPRGVFRDFSVGLSLGPGWLALRDAIGRDSQRATGAGGRINMGLRLDWATNLGAEYTTTKRGGSTFSQTAVLLGAERYFFERVFVRGGVGISWVQESIMGLVSVSNGAGFAYTAAAGGEVLQGEHVALSAEINFTMGHYESEKWEMGGVRLGLVIY